jgi:hypothetical protein
LAEERSKRPQELHKASWSKSCKTGNVQTSRMCSPQKSNKHANFTAYALPQRSHKIIRIDVGMNQLKCLLATREQYVNRTVFVSFKKGNKKEKKEI